MPGQPVKRGTVMYVGKLVQSDLNRTPSGESKPSNRVINKARIREGKTTEKRIVLYYRPITFLFTQHAKTLYTLK